MSSVNALARSRPRRYHRRYRGPLSLTASDGRRSGQSRELTGSQPEELVTSTVVNCITATFNGRIPLRSRRYQPFNAHRASIVERFSPIRF
jgi:hypothetical protein